MKKILLISALLCVVCSCGSENGGSKKYNEDVVKADRAEYKEYMKLAFEQEMCGNKAKAVKYYEAAEIIENAYSETEYSHWFNLKVSEKLTELKGTLPTGAYEGHEWVDLGLSVNWATCNVGACKPGDCGDYYFYSRSIMDGDLENAPGAAMDWGDNWRMPTAEEWQQLIDCCTWIWMSQDGHYGYKVVSKKNGQSIFLPAAGHMDLDGGLHGVGKIGAYWGYESDDDAYNMHFDNQSQYMIFIATVDYRNIRPVLDK